MVLSDNLKNTDFIYLYVESFKWASHADVEEFHGHPKPKHVYRCMHNKDTNGYRLLYSVDNGTGKAVIIDSIDNSDIEHGFVCKMHPITRDNILNFDINEEDLDALLHWVETDNSDLKNIMKPKKQIEEPTITMLDEEAGDFFATSLELRNIDPLLFDAIHELMIAICDEKPDDSSIDTTWINLSPRFGTGANISKALEYISRYAGENRRTNLSKEDLFEAIKCLLNEYNQRQFNG